MVTSLRALIRGILREAEQWEPGKRTRADNGEDESFDAVRIVIEGPTSVSENTITRKEAEVLLSSLLRVLRPVPEGR